MPAGPDSSVQTRGSPEEDGNRDAIKDGNRDGNPDAIR
jgi:hypothetical protein